MLDLEYGWCTVVAGSCSTSGSQLLLCHQSFKHKSFNVYVSVYLCAPAWLPAVLVFNDS